MFGGGLGGSVVNSANIDNGQVPGQVGSCRGSGNGFRSLLTIDMTVVNQGMKPMVINFFLNV